MSDLLQDSRAVIDQIDGQMVRLFEQRMEAAEGIARYKWERSIPIFDPSRECQMLKNTARLQKQELSPYYEKFLQSLMELSKEYQKELLRRFEAEDGSNI